MAAPFRVVFSGPAAGTVSAAHFGERIGAANLICADVGGTSCDISIVTDGQPTVNTTFELEHDLVVNALSTEISSLGAGGGSIVSINRAGEIQVGPGSAGADPGPAAYGKGGTEPTMSDAFLLIGILDPGRFAGGSLSLDADLAREAFERLDSSLDLGERVAYAYRMGLNNVAEGIVDISIGHGVDPRDYSLLAFGAAGPMMLPALLDETRVQSVIVPPHPGLFSALGLLSSDLVYADSRSSYQMLSADTAGAVDDLFTQMEDGLRSELGDGVQGVEFERSMDARLVGQTWETPFIDVPGGTIDEAAIDTMIETFHVAYQQRTGNRFDALPVQGVTYRVQAKVPIEKVAYPPIDRRNGGAPDVGREITLRLHLRRGDHRARVRPRQAPVRRRHRGPRDHPRGAVHHPGLPRPARHRRALRRDRDREGVTHDRDRPPLRAAVQADPRPVRRRVRGALQLRALHRLGARQPLPLHRPAHVHRAC